VGATLSGSLVMFFGYPETTPIALAAIGLYLACGATVIASADPRALTTAKVWSFASATFAVTAHGAGLLLLPSLALLVVAPFGAPPGSKWARWKPLVSGQSVSLFIALVVAPILAISVLPYFPVKNLGNMTGGGDDVMLVPLTINYAHRDGGYYPFVSWWHFLDIANAMWIAAPFAVPLLVGAAAVKRRCRIRLSAAEAHALAFIAAAAAFCLFIPVAWNHDFGMWGDWNIAVCYLFPLNALAWLSAIIVLRRFRLRAGHWLGMLAPLVLVQAACAVGLMALLY
jgi:hypothetical protein